MVKTAGHANARGRIATFTASMTKVRSMGMGSAHPRLAWIAETFETHRRIGLIPLHIHTVTLRARRCLYTQTVVDATNLYVKMAKPVMIQMAKEKIESGNYLRRELTTGFAKKRLMATIAFFRTYA